MEAQLIGETAAIVTSLLWTFNSIFFTLGGKRIGSISVNAYRIVMAVALLSVAHFILLGTFLPLAADGQWFWIGMSGIVGLGIGDFALFAAFVIIGPRRSVLMMALSGLFAAFGAYLLMGETLGPYAMLGIGITILGVMIVILEQEGRSSEEPLSPRMKNLGILLALVGAAGQGIGIALAKKGMLLDPDAALHPLSATLIRMIVGAIFVWAIILLWGKLPELRKGIKDRQGMKYTAAGAFIGPFIGVTLSMVAVTMTKAGIAQTLMSLMPVMIIPVMWFMYGQKTTWRGVLGAFVTVIGVAILFLV